MFVLFYLIVCLCGCVLVCFVVCFNSVVLVGDLVMVFLFWLTCLLVFLLVVPFPFGFVT